MEEYQYSWTDMQVNNVFLTIVSLAVVTGSIIFLRMYSKKHPNLKSGALINKLIAENRDSIFLAGAVLANFAEAMVSASIHPPGQMPINSFTRFLLHTVVAVMSITFAVFFAQAVKSFFEALFDKEIWKKQPGRLFVKLFLMVILFAGMIGGPLLNLFIVANGTGEVLNCKLLLMDLIYSDKYMNYVYDNLGFPPGYDPYSAMSYIMVSSLGTTIFHYFSMMANGAITIDRKKEDSYDYEGTSINEKINNKDAEEKESDIKSFKDSVRYLAIRYGYRGNELSKLETAANKQLDSIIEDGDKIRISGNFAKLCKEIKNFDHNEKPQLEQKGEKGKIDDRNNQYKNRIRNLFQGKTSNGQGLGLQLKK